MYVCIMLCRLDKHILHLRSLEKRVMSIIMKRTMKPVYRFILPVISTRILYYVYSLGTHLKYTYIAHKHPNILANL